MCPKLSVLDIVIYMNYMSTVLAPAEQAICSSRRENQNTDVKARKLTDPNINAWSAALKVV